MGKCKVIGVHLTKSEYYGATEESRGVTDIYCNIELPKRKMHSINASVVVFEDRVAVCLKCENLDEEVKNRILCKFPDMDTNISNKSSYSHIALQCHYSNYIANEEKPTKFGSTSYRKRYDTPRATYQEFRTDVCNDCYLNPKKYAKK